MADVARAGPTAMSTPGRREACLAQAGIFGRMAEADPVNGGYWLDEAIRWLDRAATPVGPVVVTVERTASASPEVPARGRRVSSAPAQPR